MENFYVYVYLDPRKPGIYEYNDLKFGYEPFYIGKGKGNRCYSGILDRKKCRKITKIKAIMDSGNRPLIIKIYQNLSEYDSFMFEIFLINLIGRNDLDNGPLTNMTDGGDGSSGRTDTDLDTLRKKMFKHTPEYKEKMSKPVIQYGLDMNIINEFNSVKEASEKTNTVKQNISSALTGKYKTANGFIWKYKNESDILQGHLKESFRMPKHSKETILKMQNSAKRGNEHHMKNKTGINNKRSRKVLQKDNNGIHIKIWDSLSDIKKELGFTTSNICRCCQGTVKRIGGFTWEYYIDPIMDL